MTKYTHHLGFWLWSFALFLRILVYANHCLENIMSGPNLDETKQAMLLVCRYSKHSYKLFLIKFQYKTLSSPCSWIISSISFKRRSLRMRMALISFFLR